MKTGVDIVQISRIKLDEKFINFVLSEKEKEILKTKVKKEEFLAGRFAAKEAFLKAHKKGIGDIPLKDIEVLYQEAGNPIIVYNNNVYESVSISHDGDYAIAMVVIS